MYFRVGVTPGGSRSATAPSNHSDYFYVDEKAIPIALRALTQVAVDYLSAVSVDRSGRSSVRQRPAAGRPR